MIRERLALLMTALVMVVCLGVAQAQSADSTPTPTRFFTLRIRDWRTTATTETIQQPATATPTATPRPGGPTGPVHTVGEGIPGVDAAADPNATPTSTPRSPADLTAIAVRQTAAPAAGPSDGDPLEQTGDVHTVGEDIFDIDAAATALHQMIHSPDDPRAFRSICDLPPRGPADVAACDLYKAAYKLKHGNPCRHNDEGEAICLH